MKLTERVIVEEVPCGTCYTTQHLAEDGTVVRQDILVQVRPELLVKSNGEETKDGHHPGDLQLIQNRNTDRDA